MTFNNTRCIVTAVYYVNGVADPNSASFSNAKNDTPPIKSIPAPTSQSDSYGDLENIDVKRPAIPPIFSTQQKSIEPRSSSRMANRMNPVQISGHGGHDHHGHGHDHGNHNHGDGHHGSPYELYHREYPYDLMIENQIGTNDLIQDIIDSIKGIGGIDPLNKKFEHIFNSLINSPIPEIGARQEHKKKPMKSFFEKYLDTLSSYAEKNKDKDAYDGVTNITNKDKAKKNRPAQIAQNFYDIIFELEDISDGIRSDLKIVKESFEATMKDDNDYKKNKAEIEEAEKYINNAIKDQRDSFFQEFYSKIKAIVDFEDQKKKQKFIWITSGIVSFFSNPNRFFFVLSNLSGFRKIIKDYKEFEKDKKPSESPDYEKMIKRVVTALEIDKVDRSKKFFCFSEDMKTRNKAISDILSTVEPVKSGLKKRKSLDNLLGFSRLASDYKVDSNIPRLTSDDVSQKKVIQALFYKEFNPQLGMSEKKVEYRKVDSSNIFENKSEVIKTKDGKEIKVDPENIEYITNSSIYLFNTFFSAMRDINDHDYGMEKIYRVAEFFKERGQAYSENKINEALNQIKIGSPSLNRAIEGIGEEIEMVEHSLTELLNNTNNKLSAAQLDSIKKYLGKLKQGTASKLEEFDESINTLNGCVQGSLSSFYDSLFGSLKMIFKEKNGEGKFELKDIFKDPSLRTKAFPIAERIIEADLNSLITQTTRYENIQEFMNNYDPSDPNALKHSKALTINKKDLEEGGPSTFPWIEATRKKVQSSMSNLIEGIDSMIERVNHAKRATRDTNTVKEHLKRTEYEEQKGVDRLVKLTGLVSSGHHDHGSSGTTINVNSGKGAQKIQEGGHGHDHHHGHHDSHEGHGHNHSRRHVKEDSRYPIRDGGRSI